MRWYNLLLTTSLIIILRLETVVTAQYVSNKCDISDNPILILQYNNKTKSYSVLGQASSSSYPSTTEEEADIDPTSLNTNASNVHTNDNNNKIPSTVIYARHCSCANNEQYSRYEYKSNYYCEPQYDYCYVPKYNFYDTVPYCFNEPILLVTTRIMWRPTIIVWCLLLTFVLVSGMGRKLFYGCLSYCCYIAVPFGDNMNIRIVNYLLRYKRNVANTMIRTYISDQERIVSRQQLHEERRRQQREGGGPYQQQSRFFSFLSIFNFYNNHNNNNNNTNTTTPAATTTTQQEEIHHQDQLPNTEQQPSFPTNVDVVQQQEDVPPQSVTIIISEDQQQQQQQQDDDERRNNDGNDQQRERQEGLPRRNRRRRIITRQVEYEIRTKIYYNQQQHKRQHKRQQQPSLFKSRENVESNSNQVLPTFKNDISTTTNNNNNESIICCSNSCIDPENQLAQQGTYDNNDLLIYDSDEASTTLLSSLSKIPKHKPIECSICFNTIENGTRVGNLECSHLFHIDCLKTWVQRRNVCPLCLQPNVAKERRSSSPNTTI